jgi:hypothetical protein
MTNTPEDPDVQYDDETNRPGEGEPAAESDGPAEQDSEGESKQDEPTA